MSNIIDAYIENAIHWAEAHLDCKEYIYLCLCFIEDAVEKANGIELFGGDCATASALLYYADQHTDVPPKGAFVFMIAMALPTGNM